MSDIQFEFVVESNIEGVKKEFAEGVDHAVRTAAFAWEAEAKQTLREGFGVDTGAMRAGISVVTARDSELEAHTNEARALYAAKGAEAFPVGQLPEAGKPPAGEAWVISPAAYSAHQEFGTRRVQARRFMQRGKQRAEQVLRQALEEAGRRL